MSVTHPEGVASSVNQSIVLATFLLSLGALATLLLHALSHPANPYSRPSLVYGLCLFACCLCSYAYNARLFPRELSLLRKLDHAAIFLLIAGTYTPFVAGGIRGLFGIPLIDWVWGLALMGILIRLQLPECYDRVVVGLYLLLGWLFLTALPEILRLTAPTPLIFLGLGALFYTVGALVFARDIGRWTDPVWHSFVLVAATLHFLAVASLLV
ncbi:MAG: hemolysin III family protein [Pseudomonadota bacterium]|nr:hemolysin III family protein [Pseudomonadota bacterium]